MNYPWYEYVITGLFFLIPAILGIWAAKKDVPKKKRKKRRVWSFWLNIFKYKRHNK